MTEPRPPIDRSTFRTALGRFPTGVTVVTALSPKGAPVGLTANSFNSVSLDPPLVLWSLAKAAQLRTIFEAAPYYAINVLAADQIGVSRQFASRAHDRFEGIAWRPGLGGAPLIAGSAAQFECRNLRRYEGGDHLIFVGEVERFADLERPALAYHASDYMVTAHHPERLALSAGERFLDDDVQHLLARASHHASGPFAGPLKRARVAAAEWRVLAALADQGRLPITRLARLVLMKQPTLTKLVDRMARRGLVERKASAGDRRAVLVAATPAGRTLARKLARAARRHEADLLAGYGYGEVASLKAALRGLISRLGDGPRAEKPAGNNEMARGTKRAAKDKGAQKTKGASKD
ncbi:MAG TPA: flavin reductase [Alphaproteobacteria bacterium]|nr:flavin reductase [Alphaproteobacteria bacterium]